MRHERESETAACILPVALAVSLGLAAWITGALVVGSGAWTWGYAAAEGKASIGEQERGR